MKTTVNQRIISLVPSITEIIYALDQEEKLVGVTKYCDFPPEAQTLPKVGGFLDLDLEAVLRLRPTVVIGMPAHKHEAKKLELLGIQTILLEQETTADIFQAIDTVGTLLHKEQRAKRLISSIQENLSRFSRDAPSTKRPSVLVVIGGHQNPNAITPVYAAGQSTFYDELITLAGGKNVMSTTKRYATLSAEAIVTHNPAIVIDIIPGPELSQEDKAHLTDQWKELPGLRAAKNGTIYFITKEYSVNPGPRIYKTLKLFSDALEKARAHDD